MQYVYSPRTHFVFINHVLVNGLPETIDVHGTTLVRKSEFHVSLLSLSQLAPFVGSSDEASVIARLHDHFNEFVASHDMTSVRYTGELRLVKRGDRISLIMMVEVPYIEELFASLRAAFHADFPLQPTHLTLYTLGLDKGIGILSEDELMRESEAVAVPELSGVLAVA